MSVEGTGPTALSMTQSRLMVLRVDGSEAIAVHLSDWMHAHLRVAPSRSKMRTHSTGSRAGSSPSSLNPPLNLAKMPKSEVRARLTQLRKLQGKWLDGRAVERVRGRRWLRRFGRSGPFRRLS